MKYKVGQEVLLKGVIEKSDQYYPRVRIDDCVNGTSLVQLTVHHEALKYTELEQKCKDLERKLKSAKAKIKKLEIVVSWANYD